MMGIFKSTDGRLTQIEEIETQSWINLTDPTEDEIAYIIEALDIEPQFVKAALDEEELSHIDTESDQKFVVVDVPIREYDAKGHIKYTTIPLAIILTEQYVLTICVQETPIISDFINGAVKNVYTNLKTRFVLQILYRAAITFLIYLKQIDKISGYTEKQLQKSMKNKELLQLLEIEKSLVYFSTSLKANEVTLEKLLRGRLLTLYEEDKDLLEDVLLEVKQAIEMCTIYRDILSGTMDAFASVVSNNLNIVMKVLTSITILMAIPNMITSFYGMNVDLPFAEFGYLMPLGISLVIVAISAFFLRKQNML